MSLFKGKQGFRVLYKSSNPYSFILRNLSSVQNLKLSTEQITNKDPIIENDATFFKHLGKTVNNYWIQNAPEVFQRLDWNRLLEPSESFKEDLRRRACDDKVDLKKIQVLWKELETVEGDKERRALMEKLVAAALWVPNETHKAATAVEGDIPLPIFVHGHPQIGLKVEEFQKFCERNNFLKNDNLGNLAHHKSYFTKGPLAELEDALVRYSLNSIKKAGFQLISVPDILFPHVIESCGMRTRGDRDQVFWLELPDSKETEACLSGTAEMSIAGSLQNCIFEEVELPIKLAAVSRCYRAETSSVDEERGIYRVHEFTKVELFGVTANETHEESNKLHEEFRLLQESIFSQLGLHYKTLEMPPIELGLPAFRKFDIEAWMPGRKMFGEISSTSNCTDFQSRRLNIRYRTKNDLNLKFVHTVNGTACAVPRMLITLVETYQGTEGSVNLPQALNKFMMRSWDESVKAHSKVAHKSTFLRTKSSQEKYTKQFRTMEL